MRRPAAEPRGGGGGGAGAGHGGRGEDKAASSGKWKRERSKAKGGLRRHRDTFERDEEKMDRERRRE
jgi:hypothetical protein